jgi:hypothetical protein
MTTSGRANFILLFSPPPASRATPVTRPDQATAVID